MQGVKQCIDELANLQRAGYSLDEALAIIRKKDFFASVSSKQRAATALDSV